MTTGRLSDNCCHSMWAWICWLTIWVVNSLHSTH